VDIRLEDEVPMSAQELWRTLHTPEFDAFLAREYEFKASMELERRVSDNRIHRRVRIITGTDLSYIPFGLAHKILGGNEIIYEEIQDKSLDRYDMRWKNEWIEPSSLKDRIQVSGVLRLIPVDEGRCKRIREVNLRIRMPGVGHILEGMAADQAKKTSKKFSDAVAKWASEKARRPKS
jgi:hypothetical protein